MTLQINASVKILIHGDQKVYIYIYIYIYEMMYTTEASIISNIAAIHFFSFTEPEIAYARGENSIKDHHFEDQLAGVSAVQRTRQKSLLMSSFKLESLFLIPEMAMFSQF